MSDFRTAYVEALLRISSAQTPEDRREAEDAMTALIRGVGRREPERFDPKRAAAGRDDD